MPDWLTGRTDEMEGRPAGVTRGPLPFVKCYAAKAFSAGNRAVWLSSAR